MKKVVDTSTDVTSISFNPSTNYEFLFKDSELIGVRVETAEERKTYYCFGENEEKLTDDILKSALKSFAELDFHNFDIIVNLFLSKNPEKYTLAQEIFKERFEQLSNSIIAQDLDC